MTFEHHEAEAARQRKLYAEDPDQYRIELHRGIRNHAALIERVFTFGSSVRLAGEHLHLDGDGELAVTFALGRLAKDIREAAEWLASDDHEMAQQIGGTR